MFSFVKSDWRVSQSTHFIPLVSFCTLWKKKKIRGLLIFLGCTEREQWDEVGKERKRWYRIPQVLPMTSMKTKMIAHLCILKNQQTSNFLFSSESTERDHWDEVMFLISPDSKILHKQNCITVSFTFIFMYTLHSYFLHIVLLDILCQRTGLTHSFSMHPFSTP